MRLEGGRVATGERRIAESLRPLLTWQMPPCPPPGPHLKLNIAKNQKLVTIDRNVYIL